MQRAISHTLLAVALFAVAALMTIPGNAQSLRAQPSAGVLPVEIDFGADPAHRHFITAREMELRARSLNLLLLPDDPARNLQDFRAETIPAYGKEFELRAPGRGRVYLHLDMVSFAALDAEEGDAAATRHQKVRWMEIFVNGHLLKTVHMGGGVYVKSPLVLLIEREHTMDRRLRVRLRPAPGDSFFAIWDAYVSRHAPAMRDDQNALSDWRKRPQ